MKKLLYVTDLYYNAKGRLYYEEDLFLTSKLREDFKLVICHPQDIENFERDCDLIIFRNAGPVANFKDKYLEFRKRVVSNTLKTYNSFNGKADMNGKQYLLDLTKKKFPVIPTINSLNLLDTLFDAGSYIKKPQDGADSLGIEILSKKELSQQPNLNDGNTLIQPLIDFKYEVSFYYIDKEFQYSLYAPDRNKRWELVEYVPTEDDLAFAKSFIEWNNLKWGIQRVDACRTKNGELLLVELEDLNPYLSLLEVGSKKAISFITNFKYSIQKALDA